MAENANAPDSRRYVGTLVGESTSQEFRLAVAHETIREQDIIAVDARLRRPDRDQIEDIRVWAKVQRIERVNPLFPTEAGHELAATRTNPLDTVLSFSREMVTAVCRVLGTEPVAGNKAGRLDHLRYPPQPASSAYRPDSVDIARVVLGDLAQRESRALDIASLSNRTDVDAKVDGHHVVMRHLAILAMTGAGKSWTARRIIEQLAEKDYPIVIFDPHGDYTGLAAVPELRERVKLFRAHLPILDEDGGDAVQIINGLSGEEITPTQLDAFDSFFGAAKELLRADGGLDLLSTELLKITQNQYLSTYGLRADLFGLSYLADALARLCKEKDDVRSSCLESLGFEGGYPLTPKLAGTYNALARKLRRSALAVRRMESINQARAGAAAPLPLDRTKLVAYGQLSVVSLAGYSEELQATLFTLISETLFTARVRGEVRYPFVLVLEEAHNFVPGKSEHPSVLRSIAMTRQIAQEGRKFGVGLILISQRPSRLDETTLSQCNSYVIMRMVNPADQNFVRRVVETISDDEARMLPGLNVGEAILSGQMINFPVLARIKEPSSKGEREEQDAFAVLEDAFHSATATRR